MSYHICLCPTTFPPIQLATARQGFTRQALCKLRKKYFRYNHRF